MANCEKINEMISGYLDDELVQGDQQRVEGHLKNCSACQQVFEDMRKLRDAVSKSSVEVQLSQEQLDLIMNDVPAKASAGIGWILLITGVICLASFAGWHFAIDDEVPMLVKLFVCLIGFGLVSLFVSVLRQRLVAMKSDRHRDVQI